MFTAELKYTCLFKALFVCLGKIIDNVTLDCTDEGLRIHSMDKAQIALIDVLLPIEMFKNYNCHHNYALGINIGSMLKVLNLAKSNDIINLKYQQNSHQLLLTFADTSIFFSF